MEERNEVGYRAENREEYNAYMREYNRKRRVKLLG